MILRRTPKAYLVRNIIAICLGYYGVLLEDVMHQLWCDDYLDLPIYRLRSRVDKLPGFATLLTFRRRLC